MHIALFSTHWALQVLIVSSVLPLILGCLVLTWSLLTCDPHPLWSNLVFPLLPYCKWLSRGHRKKQYRIIEALLTAEQQDNAVYTSGVHCIVLAYVVAIIAYCLLRDICRSFLFSVWRVHFTLWYEFCPNLLCGKKCTALVFSCRSYNSLICFAKQISIFYVQTPPAVDDMHSALALYLPFLVHLIHCQSLECPESRAPSQLGEHEWLVLPEFSATFWRRGRPFDRLPLRETDKVSPWIFVVAYIASCSTVLGYARSRV